MSVSKLYREFVVCHDGRINKIVHLVGFAVVGIGIIEKSLVYVIAGGAIQECGHLYQYYMTRQYKSYCHTR